MPIGSLICVDASKTSINADSEDGEEAKHFNRGLKGPGHLEDFSSRPLKEEANFKVFLILRGKSGLFREGLHNAIAYLKIFRIAGVRGV